MLVMPGWPGKYPARSRRDRQPAFDMPSVAGGFTEVFRQPTALRAKVAGPPVRC